MEQPLKSLGFHRFPNVQIGRPYDFCFDADGDLWEAIGRLMIHHSAKTGTAEFYHAKAMTGRRGSTLAQLDGRLVFFLSPSKEYMILDPRTGDSSLHALPPKPDGGDYVIWFCLETAGKVLAFDRGEHGGVLVFDEPGGPARRITCPEGDPHLIDGVVLADGRVLIHAAERLSLFLFDPVAERFTREIKSDYDVSFTWGCMAWQNRAYVADTTGGRLLVCDLERGVWLDPIPTPDYGKLYGYIGRGFQIGSRGYFNLDTWLGDEGIDRKTMAVHKPPGYETNTVDGRTLRFLDRFLMFDAATGKFDYLVSPPQPDGVAELCYSKYRNGEVVITGHVIPVEPGREFVYKSGDYCIWRFPAPV